MSITDSQLKKLCNKAHDKPFELSDRDSLGVRVSAKGKIAWQYRFRFNGKGDRLTIGHYPHMSLKDAREEVPALRAIVFEGKNPKLAWKLRKKNTTKKDAVTLIKLVEMWLELKIKEEVFKETTLNNYKSTINKWILNSSERTKFKKNWVVEKLNIPFDDISNTQWMDYFEWIRDEGSGVVAGSVFKLLKSIVSWGAKKELINNSNLLLFNLKDVGQAPKVGERTPTVTEIARLWLEIEKSKALPQTKICLQLIILLGGRNTVVRTMEWENIDFVKGIWTIPDPKGRKETRRRGMEESDTGNQKPERHPISSKVKELLEELAFLYGKKGFVVKGERKNTALTTHAIDRFCARMSAKLFKVYGISKIVPHDFRRSLETTICEINVTWLPICEKILGHKLRGTMKHYNKADYIEQQLEVYELYWSLIETEITKLHAIQ